MFGMSSYPGGIENYIVNYFCHPSFPSDRIHVDFITYEDSIAYEDRLTEKGYHVYRVPHLKKNPIGYFQKIRAIAKDNNYDAVYVNMLTAANALPVFIAKQLKVNSIILHAHASSTISGALRRTLHNINKGWCNKSATLRFACSDEAGAWLFDNDEYTVIPNAIDPDRFTPSTQRRNIVRSKYGITDDTLLIGHIGRFATEKNHAFMVDVLKAILDSGNHAKLMFVGDGYTKDAVQQKVKDDGLADSVIFVGTSSETERYYPAFDVFLFPSTFEGFGMAALEAQSCGVLCYCSDTLSPYLNVSGKNISLSLRETPRYWAIEIVNHPIVDSKEMNQAIRQSSFNIENQIRKLSESLESLGSAKG